MKTYMFQVELEPDGEGWHVFFPDWEEIGASTWVFTQEQALNHIQEVLLMIIEEFDEEGSPLPATNGMTVSEGPTVAITV